MASLPERGEIDARFVELSVFDQAKGVIEDSLRFNWLHNTAMPRVKIDSFLERGGSNAIILTAKVQVELAVKFHVKDAPVEALGYDILREAGLDELREHLIPALPTYGLPVLWLTPYLSADTLHTVACKDHPLQAYERRISRLYAHFLQVSKALWVTTKTSAPSDLLKQIYVPRIPERIGRLEQALHTDDLDRLTVVVNKRPFEAIGSVLTDFADMVDAAHIEYACTTHGDEHAKNIMVSRNLQLLDRTGWSLIDYTHARRQSDWLFSIARMLYWWRFYCVLEMAKTDRDLRERLEIKPLDGAMDDGKLNISYNEAQLEASVPQLCRTLDHQVMEFAETVAQEFGETAHAWQERLKLALFSVVFASALGHFEQAPFVVPVMIGESLKMLYDPTSLPG